MGTIADKLAYTEIAVDDIQAAIIEQGVDVPNDVPLGQYGNKVREISGALPSWDQNVQSMTVTAHDDTATIKWTDPSSSDWAGSTLLRKQGSPPNSPTDGVQIMDSVIRDQYSATGYVDSSLIDGATYYYLVLPRNVAGAQTFNEANRRAVSIEFVYPSPLLTFSVTATNERAVIAFTLPPDATGVRIVYKPDSFPATITDGTVIASATNGQTVTGLVNGTQYFFRAFPFNAYGRFNQATVGNQATATPKSHDPVLANNSWEDIAAASADGAADLPWKPGDKKTMPLGGVTYEFTLYGKNHDDLHSSDPRYNDAAYNKGTKKAGLTFVLTNSMATTYKMNSTNTNADGWDGSQMRTQTMLQMIALMPASVQALLRTVAKLTWSAGSGGSVVTSADKAFVLSENEVFDTITHSRGGEGTQYDYFKAGNSKVKTVVGLASLWFERSPRSNNSAGFCAVTAGGLASYSAASIPIGLSWGFSL